MNSATEPSFEQQMQRIERLVEQIEQSSDPATQDAARVMVRSLLDLHAAGLSRMLELMSHAARDACMEDDLVRSLLLLHGLHPEELEARVRQALEKVRPYLQSHGGDVQLLGMTETSVRLELQGSCDGCPSSQATLQSLIEQAILEAAPEIADIEVEGVEDPAPAGLVSIELPSKTA